MTERRRRDGTARPATAPPSGRRVVVGPMGPLAAANDNRPSLAHRMLRLALAATALAAVAALGWAVLATFG